jgi:hypothetical protein
MKTLSPLAKNRAIRLQQEIVPILRGTGSLEGAEQYWRHVDFTQGFGRKLACYGFGKRQRQALISKVAFPDANFSEVDAALAAGNRLPQLYQLASGTASIARDSNNEYKQARNGLRIIRLHKSSPKLS